MGLDTSHDCWHGGYGGFSTFRRLIGRAAGLPYRKPNLTLGEFGHDVLDIDWDSITERQIMGHWDRRGPTVARGPGYDAPITDPVLYLLIHSDCDGKLRRGYLPALKARLEELVPKYDELVDLYLEGRLQQFIDGLGRAIEAGEHIDFH